MNQPQPTDISLTDFLAWESQQTDKYEWIDGMVVRCAGGTYEHAAIISNLHSLIHAALTATPCFVQNSDRKLVPRDAQGRDLGSFYSDLFVSCAPEDRTGIAAHFPTLVIEVLSAHAGGEFTTKRDAYMASRDIREYVIVDATRRYCVRYAWTAERVFTTDEFYRGPLTLDALGIGLTFDQIYAETNVPPVLRPVHGDGGITAGG